MKGLANDRLHATWHNDTPAGGLTIGQVSRLTGVAARTIRYYESAGLLPRPAREANNYRRFSMTEVHRLRLLGHLRQLRVPLSAARPLLADAADARCAEVQDAVRALVQDRLRALAQELAELQQLQRDLETYERVLRECLPDARMLFRECSEMACLAFPQKECACDDACCA